MIVNISTAPTEAMEGELYEYQIIIEDPDDDSFTFQLINAPEGMTIDFVNSLLTWTPAAGGTYGPITLKVFDGGENFSSPSLENFTIEVDYLSDFITMEFDLHEDNNLISFFSLSSTFNFIQVQYLKLTRLKPLLLGYLPQHDHRAQGSPRGHHQFQALVPSRPFLPTPHHVFSNA